MREWKVAALQMRSTRSWQKNRDDMLDLAKQAASAGAHYVQTPEICNLCERDAQALAQNSFEQADDPTLASAREFARQHKRWLHLGSLILRTADKYANRAFLIGPEGEIATQYDKIHLFDVDLPNGESWRESARFNPGPCAVVAQAGVAKIGLAICYDLRFPALFSALAQGGAEVLTAPACFTRQTGEAHWQVLQRARAIENACFMVSAAQGGLHADGRETYGHSIIVDPWGKVLAEGGDSPGVIGATLDLDEVVRVRARVPVLAHARPFAAP